MEEADAFIKEACRHLNCSFADDSDITFSTPQIFEFLIRCIWKIDKDSRRVITSHVYPNVITTRLHLGNAISSYLQKFHIRGDVALHTVLYGNINNLRSAFIELIRKLPTDSHERSDQDQERLVFQSALDCWETQPKWVPVYCRSLHRPKHQWIVSDNQPEIFPLHLFDKDSAKTDPRRWISQYLNSSSLKPKPALPAKPALPPKPVFSKNQQNAQSDEVPDEASLIRAKYDEKLYEYQELESRREQIERENREMTAKLARFDPELLAALDDPETYAEELLNKLTELNDQIESDTLRIEENKRLAAKKKLEVAAEMKRLGIFDADRKHVEEMAEVLKTIDGKIEHNHVLVQKLSQKLKKTDGDNIYDYEKRSKDLDDMVRKQESDMVKMQDERYVLRKQAERENETVNRSFAIIYNILLQHCESYRGRLAMESFTRIHLYCMEIMEMLRENGALKQMVNCLENEIYAEEQKQFDKKCDLLNRDLQEVVNSNNEMLAEIQVKDPDFALPEEPEPNSKSHFSI